MTRDQRNMTQILRRNHQDMSCFGGGNVFEGLQASLLFEALQQRFVPTHHPSPRAGFVDMACCSHVGFFAHRPQRFMCG